MRNANKSEPAALEIKQLQRSGGQNESLDGIMVSTADYCPSLHKLFF